MNEVYGQDPTLESNEANLVNPSFEPYDDELIQNLVSSQKWAIEADGLYEEDAIDLKKRMNTECRIFQREDETCTILVEQMGILDETRDGMHNRVYDTVPEVMRENNQQR